MSNISLTKLLYAGLFVGIAVILSIAGFTIWQNSITASQMNKIYNHPFIVINNVRDIRVDVRALWEITTKAAYQDVLADDAGKQMMDIEEKIEKELAIVKAQFLGSKRDVEDIRAEYDKFKAIIHKAIKLKEIEGAKSSARYLENNDAEKTYKQISKEIDDVINFAKNTALTVTNQSNEIHNQETRNIVLFSISLLFVGLIVGSILMRRIRKEFKEIEDAVENIKNDNYQKIQMRQHGLKEFMDLKYAINKMVDSITQSRKDIENKNEEILRQNLALMEQSRSLEEMNTELDASLEEATRSNEMLSRQARQLEELNTELDASFEEAKRTNTMLDSERKRYAALLEFASDGIHILDMDGHVLEFSQSFADMLGYSYSEVYSLNVIDIDAVIPKEKLIESIRALANEYVILETKHKRKDGTIIDVEVNARGVQINGNTYLYASARDISLRKQLEADRQELSERLGKIADRVPGVVFQFRLRTDGSSCVPYASNALLDIYRVDPIEVVDDASKVFAVVHPDDLDMHLASIGESAQNLSPWRNEYRVRFDDGTVQWLYGNALPEKESDGSVLWHGFITDITERKRIEESLKSTSETLQKLLNEQEAILQVKTTGFVHLKDRKFLWTNETFEEMLGYERGELQGVPTNIMYIDDEEYQKYGAEGYKILSETGTFTRETRCVRKDGTPVWLLASMTVLDGLDDEIVGVAIDITKQKQLEENLQALVSEETSKRLEKEKLLLQQSKMAMMGEMIGAIAHQWRQPLNTLGLNIQDVSIAYRFGEMNEEYIDEFKVNSMSIIQKMSKTIDDFRNFFKPVKAKCDFSMVKAVEETLNIINPQLKSHAIALNFDKNEDYAVHGYQNEIEQAILIIISNAQDALLENNINEPKIDICMRDAKDGKVELAIEDNAGGIPESIIDRVFEPYFTTKEQGKGTGIGLYMAKEIVERQMGGKLSVKNLNGGAKFVISIAGRKIFNNKDELDVE